MENVVEFLILEYNKLLSPNGLKINRSHHIKKKKKKQTEEKEKR